MTYSLPANSLCQNGQGLRIRGCFKNTSSDTVTYKLYFGAQSISFACTTTTGGRGELLVYRLASASQQVIASGFAADTTVAAQTFTSATNDDTTALTIKLTATATSSGANATAELLSVEFLQKV